MDFTRLTQGEKIAGLSGIALLLIMFIFKWFGLKAGVGGFTAEGETRNAWGSYGFFDIVLFVTVVAAVGFVFISASRERSWAAGRRQRGGRRPGGPLGRADRDQHHQPAGFRAWTYRARASIRPGRSASGSG